MKKQQKSSTSVSYPDQEEGYYDYLKDYLNDGVTELPLHPDYGIVPPKPGTPYHNIRAIIEYCKEKGITTEEISKEELAQFILGYW